MKKILVALSFALVATGASANIVSGGLTLVGDAPETIVPTPGDDGWGGNGSTLQPAGLYTAGNTGTLYANQDGVFTATYLGQVASFSNDYVSGLGMVLNGVNTGGSVGSSTSQSVTAGNIVNFHFQENGYNGFSTFANGQANLAFQGMIFLDASPWNSIYGTAYDFLIGYNDSAPVNNDYDDYVVGVVNSVPVPAALPLMASALGMFGISRRKSKAKAA